MSWQDATLEKIRAAGFIGNTHYCPDCMNEYYADEGQHAEDCPWEPEEEDE